MWSGVRIPPIPIIKTNMSHADYVKKMKFKLLMGDENHIMLRDALLKLYRLEKSKNAKTRPYQERIKQCEQRIDYLIKVIENKQ